MIMVMGLIDDRKNLNWRLRLGIQVALRSDPGRLGDPRHAVLAVHPSPPRRRGDGAVDRRPDQCVQHAGQHGRAGGQRRPDRRGPVLRGQVAVGSLFAPAVLLVVVGALGGFLVHNHAPARLFMGDAGSNFLGFLLGALTVVGTYFRYGRDDSPYSVLAPLLVMAVPLYDMTSVILIRLREGRSPFQGDRRHFSHRLVARGLTPPQAVWTIDLVTLAGGLGALLLHRLDAWGAAWSWPRRPACWVWWRSWSWQEWTAGGARRARARRDKGKSMTRRGVRSSASPAPRSHRIPGNRPR